MDGWDDRVKAVYFFQKEFFGRKKSVRPFIDPDSPVPLSFFNLPENLYHSNHRRARVLPLAEPVGTCQGEPDFIFPGEFYSSDPTG